MSERIARELDALEWERDQALADVALLEADLDANVRLLEEKDEQIADLRAEVEYLKRQLGVLD